MSDRDDAVPELSADAEAAWHAFAGSIAPDDGAQARVLQRMRARTRGTVERDEDENDAPPMRRAAAAVLVMKSSAISVGLAGGALLSIKLIAAALRPSAPAPEPPAVVIPEPPPAARPVANARVPAPPQPAIAPMIPVEVPEIAPPVQRPTRVPTSASVATDSLQAEVELIGRVRAALHAREHARALELIADHRTRFPAGSFVEEREAFAAIATCREGSVKGPELARAFASAHPHSVQLAAVRAACDAIANESMDWGTRQQ